MLEERKQGLEIRQVQFEYREGITKSIYYRALTQTPSTAIPHIPMPARSAHTDSSVPSLPQQSHGPLRSTTHESAYVLALASSLTQTKTQLALPRTAKRVSTRRTIGIIDGRGRMSVQTRRISTTTGSLDRHLLPKPVSTTAHLRADPTDSAVPRRIRLQSILARR